MGSSSTIDSYCPTCGSNSSSDDEDTIPTRVNELWSLVDDESSSSEKLDDLMRSIMRSMLHLKRHTSLYLGQMEIDKLVQSTVKLIGSSDNSGATSENQKLALRLLSELSNCKLLDCDQTKLVYRILNEALRAAIDNDEQYPTCLIGSLSQCLSHLDYEHVIIEEEAADLMKQLIPVAGMAFNKETSNLSHEDRFWLVRYKGFHKFCPSDITSIHSNYRGLIICLHSLARYYGLDEYYEYAINVFQSAELEGVVTSEVLVALNVLMIINETSRGWHVSLNKYGSEDFIEELAQITMRLMCISNDYIRGHLVYLLYDKLYKRSGRVDVYEMSTLLIHHLLTKHDDPVADRFALRILLSTCKDSAGVRDVCKAKKRGIIDKLNQEVEVDRKLKEELIGYLSVDDEPERRARRAQRHGRAQRRGRA